LPSLPESLIYLKVKNCENLHSLPRFSDSLTTLYIENCENLHPLPSLPESLKVLSVSNIESINSLPRLPDSLTSLYIENCENLHCLPQLPESLTSLRINKESFVCLPNKPENLIVYDYSGVRLPDVTDEIPICDETVDCSSISHVTARVFYDVDGSNSFTSGDITPEACKVKLTSSDYSYTSLTNDEGNVMITLPPGEYTIDIDGLPDNYTTTPLSNTFTVSENETVHQDFILTASASIYDASIFMWQTTPRPGFMHKCMISCMNEGTVDFNGTVAFKVPDNFTVDAEKTTGYTEDSATNTLEWDISELSPFLSERIYVYGTLDADASLLGTTLEASATINVTNGTDINLDNNEAIARRTIVGSYDPNDIVARETMTPTEVASGEYIQYHIRFQNTGTFYAENIKVIDDISSDLDIETFELIGTSHDCETSIIDNKLVFKFNEIMLPAKQDDEEGSNGYIIFRIKPVTSLSEGDQVENLAAIYFDFNEPIITNTAVTRIETPASPSGILGVSCSAAGTQQTFTVAPEHTINASSYNWYAKDGDIQNFQVVTGTASATADFTAYFIGGEVCVGIMYNGAPYFQELCKAITLCNGQLPPANTAPSVSFASPINGATFLPGDTFTATVNVSHTDGSVSSVSLI